MSLQCSDSCHTIIVPINSVILVTNYSKCKSEDNWCSRLRKLIEKWVNIYTTFNLVKWTPAGIPSSLPFFSVRLCFSNSLELSDQLTVCRFLNLWNAFFGRNYVTEYANIKHTSGSGCSQMHIYLSGKVLHRATHLFILLRKGTTYGEISENRL